MPFYRHYKVFFFIQLSNSRVVERKIEAPFDYIYVVRLKAREKESVRVEIPKNEEKVFEQGQDVVLEIPKEKLLWLRG